MPFFLAFTDTNDSNAIYYLRSHVINLTYRFHIGTIVFITFIVLLIAQNIFFYLKQTKSLFSKTEDRKVKQVLSGGW
jgi:hypothetical protein